MKKTKEELSQLYVDICSKYGQAQCELKSIELQMYQIRMELLEAINEKG